MAEIKEVRVIQDVSVIPEANRADPPEVHVNPGDVIRWLNSTGDKVVIEVSDDRVFEEGQIIRVIPNNGDWQSPPVKAQEVKQVGYDYGIYCFNYRRHARGLSGPRIEIP